MSEKMATHLHQLLRSLCWNTEWNYAVLWKLKHRTRMVLTWEDGYYNNQFKHDTLEGEILDSSHDGQSVHDSLGLAVAKMSYHVYSLGEGIVGQVAVTGNHQWIFAGEHDLHSRSSVEFCDGWQSQFAAGIKTIVVAAVVPHGVVQLGSLNTVSENLQLLTYIRDVFSHFQVSPSSIQSPLQFSLQNIVQTSDSSRIFGPDVFQNYLPDEAVNKDHICSSSAGIPSLQKRLNDTYSPSVPGLHLSEAVGLIGRNGLPEAISNVKLAQPLTLSKQSTDHLSGRDCGTSSPVTPNTGAHDKRQISCSSQSCLTENGTLFDVKHSAQKSAFELKSPADCESAACSTGLFHGGDHRSERKADKMVASDPSEKERLENDMEIQPWFSCLEALADLKSPFMFSTGTELHEALGPAFSQQCYPIAKEAEKADDRSTSQVPEAIESSMLTTDSGTDHLLEAVVANFRHSDTAMKCAKSFSLSESMLTTERMPEPSVNTSHTIGSSYSVGRSSFLEESTQNYLNSSDSCSIRSSASGCRDPMASLTDPGKPNKKRARPGENSRPRPRDRQLIQDRIKELRELVPNGSKCSIDSLLERTIKHMAFMQSVTKHSNKLSNCSKSKGCSNDMGVLGSGYEQGSSWAVEVGGHMKICPILVENLNMNGQMLIEMLCEDCDHFLEIAAAIRSLGLTILKGITDSHGEKTWMRFIVEGQSSRNLHRMDVLWSLVQLLQSKTAVTGVC